MKRIVMIMALVFGLGMGLAQPVNAESDLCKDDSISEELREAAGCETKTMATQFVSNLLQVVLGLVGVIAIVVIIYGGFTYMTSAGDTGKVQKGKSILIYGVVGLIVALSAFAIVRFVAGSLNKPE